jgi:hypothetical protein
MTATPLAPDLDEPRKKVVCRSYRVDHLHVCDKHIAISVSRISYERCECNLVHQAHKQAVKRPSVSDIFVGSDLLSVTL